MSATINSLSHEVTSQIFSFLPSQDQARCQLVSKGFKDGINRSYQHIYRELFSSLKKNLSDEFYAKKRADQFDFFLKKIDTLTLNDLPLQWKEVNKLYLPKGIDWDNPDTLDEKSKKYLNNFPKLQQELLLKKYIVRAMNELQRSKHKATYSRFLGLVRIPKSSSSFEETVDTLFKKCPASQSEHTWIQTQSRFYTREGRGLWLFFHGQPITGGGETQKINLQSEAFQGKPLSDLDRASKDGDLAYIRKKFLLYTPFSYPTGYYRILTPVVAALNLLIHCYQFIYFSFAYFSEDYKLTSQRLFQIAVDAKQKNITTYFLKHAWRGVFGKAFSFWGYVFGSTSLNFGIYPSILTTLKLYPETLDEIFSPVWSNHFLQTSPDLLEKIYKRCIEDQRCDLLPRRKKVGLLQPNPQGRALEWSFYIAAESGNIEAMQALLEKLLPNQDSEDRKHHHLYINAAMKGNPKTIAFVLQQKIVREHLTESESSKLILKLAMKNYHPIHTVIEELVKIHREIASKRMDLRKPNSLSTYRSLWGKALEGYALTENLHLLPPYFQSMAAKIPLESWEIALKGSVSQGNKGLFQLAGSTKIEEKNGNNNRTILDLIDDDVWEEAIESAAEEDKKTDIFESLMTHPRTLKRKPEDWRDTLHLVVQNGSRNSFQMLMDVMEKHNKLHSITENEFLQTRIIPNGFLVIVQTMIQKGYFGFIKAFEQKGFFEKKKSSLPTFVIIAQSHKCTDIADYFRSLSYYPKDDE
jgi:hypothetical protein